MRQLLAAVALLHAVHGFAIVPSHVTSVGVRPQALRMAVNSDGAEPKEVGEKNDQYALSLLFGEYTLQTRL